MVDSFGTQCLDGWCIELVAVPRYSDCLVGWCIELVDVPRYSEIMFYMLGILG